MSKGFKRKKDLDRYGIPKLYIGIPLCVILSYLFYFASPELALKMVLSPYYIVVEHEYWRLFTWIFTIPYSPDGLTLILLPIMLFFYYSLAKSLEQIWGRFMFNLYIFGSIILTDILVLLGAFYIMHFSRQVDIADFVGAGAGITHYFLISIFLAFTVVGGDNIVYLYFVLPLKMKWLGYIDLIYMLYLFISEGFFTKLIIIGLLTNYFIYFFINRKKTAPSLADRRRKANFVKAMQKRPKNTYNEDGTIQFRPKSGIIPPGTGNPPGVPVHKCAVCGRTDLNSPMMDFRFCSKCEGNYEYCSEHLYTHEHVRRMTNE